MALRFLESCESCQWPNQKWTNVRGVLFNQGVYDTSTYRHGTRSLQMSNCRNVGKLFSDTQQIWVVGAAIIFVTAAPLIRNINIIDGGAAGTLQLSAHIDSASGVAYIRRGGTTNDGTVLGTPYSIPNFSQWKWYYVELYAKLHSSTGEARLAINGTTVITYSGNTIMTANPYANFIRMGAAADDGANQLQDDIYVCDGQTGAGSDPCNDFLGDIRVDALFPNGAGNSAQFTRGGTDSGANWSQVDEASASGTWPNSDTDYVESGTIGDKDTHTFENLVSTSGTVYGVQILPWMRKTDAGVRKACSIARLSTTEVDSAERDLLTSYQYHSDIRETKPGGGDWSITDVNNAEFGYKVTS